MLKLKLQVNDEGNLVSQCGVSLDAPRVKVTTSMDKVGKTRSSSKIKFDTAVIELGRMEMPKGISLTVNPIKGLFKQYHVMTTESNLSFKGNCDISLPVIALESTSINAGIPIAEVSLCFTSDASLWTRLQVLLGLVKHVRIKDDEQETSSD